MVEFCDPTILSKADFNKNGRKITVNRQKSVTVPERKLLEVIDSSGLQIEPVACFWVEYGRLGVDFGEASHRREHYLMYYN